MSEVKSHDHDYPDAADSIQPNLSNHARSHAASGELGHIAGVADRAAADGWETSSSLPIDTTLHLCHSIRVIVMQNTLSISLSTYCLSSLLSKVGGVMV